MDSSLPTSWFPLILRKSIWYSWLGLHTLKIILMRIWIFATRFLFFDYIDPIIELSGAATTTRQETLSIRVGVPLESRNLRPGQGLLQRININLSGRINLNWIYFMVNNKFIARNQLKMDDDIASRRRCSIWALVCCWNLGVAREGVHVYVTLQQHLLVNWYDIYLPIQSETIFIIVKGIQVVLLLFDLRVLHLEPFYCTPSLQPSNHPSSLMMVLLSTG